MSDGPPAGPGPGGLPAPERAGMESPGVCLAWIDGGWTSGWFAACMAGMLSLDARLSQHIVGPKGDVIHIQSSPRIHEARNTVVDHFAALEQQPEWLLMLDADMTFEPQLLYQLMATASLNEVPILGGLCFGGGRVHEPFPTIYRLEQKEVGGRRYPSIDKVFDYPRNALVKVGATGAACLLIHRQVLAVMKEHFGTLADGRINPSPWFAEGVIGPEGQSWGEDTAFCLRAHALGIPVHVHTGIKLGHMKEQVIDEVFYDARRAVVAEDKLWKGVSGETPALNGSNLNRAEKRRLARERVG
jgi:hypothetical protein